LGPTAQSTTTALRSEVLLQLLEVTRRLAAPFDLTAVLEEIGEAARKVLSAERATIWLYDAEQQALVLAGLPAGEPPVRASVDQGILGLTARTQSIVNVPDCRQEPRFDPAVDLDYDHDVRCLLSVPLVEQWQLVGVLQVVDRSHGPFTAEDERIAEALAAQCVVFIQRERLSHSVKAAERIDREIKLAREIQMSTLPSSMPRLRGYEMAGRFVPADQTGGDTFDLVQLDERRLFILLGDASGHGIGPALSATQLTGMLRVALRLGAKLDDIFAQVNNQLVEDLPDEHFVTAFVGMLDAERHTVEYHAAGQGPLLHFHAATGECEWLTPTTYPLGFMSFGELGSSGQLELEPGDILGLISDGVYESENATGVMFGRTGVEATLREASRRSMSALLETLLVSVRRHAGGAPQADDITIVLIARQPEPTVASYVERSFGRSNAELDAIFSFIDTFFAGRPIDSELRQPVSFIVEELFTNMIKYNSGTQSEITVSLDHAPAQLTVRLVDSDVEPFDVASAPLVDVAKPLEARSIGGLGLHLVRSMADTLLYEYADRRSIVTFTKSLV
jgi:phosphoserine phosphatase